MDYRNDAPVLHELLSLEKLGYRWYYSKIEDETTIPKSRVEQCLRFLQKQNKIQITIVDNESFKLTYIMKYYNKYNQKNKDLLSIWNYKWLLCFLAIVLLCVVFSLLWEIGFWTIGITAIVSAIITMQLPSPNSVIADIEKKFGFDFEQCIYFKSNTHHQVNLGDAYGSCTYVMPRRVFRKFLVKYDSIIQNKLEGAYHESYSVNKYDCTITVSWNNF